MTKRNKKRFEAQQVLMLLGSLTHNVIVWAHHWLNAASPASPESEQAPEGSSLGSDPLPHYGPLRMVRDVFHISGILSLDEQDRLIAIVLNQDALLAHRILFSLRHLLTPLLHGESDGTCTRHLSRPEPTYFDRPRSPSRL